MSTSSLYWSTSDRNCKLSHFRTSVVLQNTWFRLVFKLSLELTRTCCSHIVSMTTHSWPTVWETSCFIQHKSLEQVDWWFVSFLPFYASVITATAIWVTLKVTYLNCGLKRSSKCVILVVFQRYLCGNGDDLKNSGLNRIRTLTSAMPVQRSTIWAIRPTWSWSLRGSAADDQEYATPILSLCRGSFTDWSSFSIPFLLWTKGSSGPVTQWRQLVSCDWSWYSHGSLIPGKFHLKINRSMKTPWQEYSGVACSYS